METEGSFITSTAGHQVKRLDSVLRNGWNTQVHEPSVTATVTFTARDFQPLSPARKSSPLGIPIRCAHANVQVHVHPTAPPIMAAPAHG